jgi:hypothetical protein
MNRYSLITLTAASLLAATAFAGGAANKVTGEFTLNDAHHRLVSAHEANDKHPQKGFLLSWRDDGTWFEMDFRDTQNTCVKVFADGQARIGGLVSDGNAPQVGRYFGFLLVDAGEPGLFVDHGFTYRVSTDYWSEEARLALLEWCDTGELAGLANQAIWPYVVTDGNLQVHNAPGKGMRKAE